MPNKSIFSKGLIIFLSLFACVSFGVTAALVVLKNNTSSNISSKPLQVDESLGLHDLTEKYNVNNIETTEITHNEGGTVWLSNYYHPYKLSVTYFSIDGLKDLDIQNKINEQIKDEAFRLIPEEEADAKSVNCYITGNFANILSLSFSSSYNNKTDGSDYSYNPGKSSGLTFDLTTGNKIDLKDCFVDNANINVIIGNSAYRSSAWDEKYMWGVWDEEKEEYIEADRRDLEEEAFKTILDIKKGNYYFTVSEYSININTPNDWINIEHERFHDDIAIFKRYATKESIFTDKYDNGYEAYFGIPYMSENIHEPFDNLITISDLYMDSFEEDKDEVTKLIEERFSLDEKLAKENPDTVIVEVLGNQDYEWDLYQSVWEKLRAVNNYNIETRSVEVVRAEFPKQFYIDNNIRAEIFNVMRNGYNSERGEVGYLLAEYFNELKEKNPDILLTVFSHGKIYTYDYNENDWTRYNERLVAQDIDALQSSTELLNESDLYQLNVDQLNKAYNEIFARHGHDFVSKDLKEYFYGFLWYAPVAKKSVSVDELNSIEQKNIETIRNRINELKG